MPWIQQLSDCSDIGKDIIFAIWTRPVQGGLPRGLFLSSSHSISVFPILHSSLRDSTGICALPPEGISPSSQLTRDIGLKSMCLHSTNVVTGAHSHRPRGGTEKEIHRYLWANLYFTQSTVVFDICLRCVGSYISGNLWFITNLLWSWRRGAGNRRGENTQMGNEPVHLSWENAFQSFKQQPSLWKKRLFFPAVMPKEKINLKWKSE